MDTKRDHYRGLCPSIGQAFYTSASVLEGMERGEYGPVTERELNAMRKATERAQKAIDKAQKAVDALTLTARHLR